MGVRGQWVARVIFAYEAAGLGFGLHDELTAAGIECHVFAPTKIARSTQQRQRKTDEKDADQILQLLRGHVLAGNPLPSVWIPDIQTRDDRELVRARLDAAEKGVAIKVQIQSLLKRHRLTRLEDLKCAWTKKACSWLRMLTRDSALGEGTARDAGQPATAVGVCAGRDRTARRGAGKPGPFAAVCRYNREAGPDARRRRVDGVGVLDRNGRSSAFCEPTSDRAYLGLVPRCYESGAAGDRKGHITRQGQSRVRRVLCQAVWARIRQDGSDCVAYQRLVERNPKHKKIAVVAAMRRLGVRMWHTARAARAAATACEGGRRTIAPAPAG